MSLIVEKRGWIVQWFKLGDPVSGGKDSSGAVFFDSREAVDKYVEKKRTEKHVIVAEPVEATAELNEAAQDARRRS